MMFFYYKIMKVILLTFIFINFSFTEKSKNKFFFSSLVSPFTIILQLLILFFLLRERQIIAFLIHPLVNYLKFFFFVKNLFKFFKKIGTFENFVF